MRRSALSGRHATELLKAERGAVKKPRGGRTTVALVYPNTYFVGMSNLGFQSVYRLINGRPDALAERAFLPGEAGRDGLSRSRAPLSTQLSTVESRTPVSEFDVVAFSVSFENDYINVAGLFALSGIPPLSKDRGESHPLVMMGGICASFNPEPVADFFDLMVVGEAEEALAELLDEYERLKLALPRAGLLERLSRIPGVYVPSLYKPPKKIARRFVKDLDVQPAHSAVLTPNTEFSDMYMVELSRGCGRHCRFCMAGYIYRPPRSRSIGSVRADILAGSRLTKKVGLVGAAVSDYPHIAELAEEFRDVEINFSASSLRADSLTPELVGLVAKGNRTVAIAPEAGSERLRAVINKNLTQEQILGAVRMLIEGGILNVRLYFMVGLPTEEDGDVDAIAELAKKAHEVQLEAARKKGRMGTLTLSVNCFIPKPWTPFQWEPMEPVERLGAKLRRVKKALAGTPNINVIHDVPKYAYLQCALSRGDRRLAGVILAAHENGGDWARAFRQEDLDIDEFAGRRRDKDEPLPWDFIGVGVKKGYLWKERERALAGKHTPPCRTDKCKGCGVC